jgi:hypothetical protein
VLFADIPSLFVVQIFGQHHESPLLPTGLSPFRLFVAALATPGVGTAIFKATQIMQPVCRNLVRQALLLQSRLVSLEYALFFVVDILFHDRNLFCCKFT